MAYHIRILIKSNAASAKNIQSNNINCQYRIEMGICNHYIARMLMVLSCRAVDSEDINNVGCTNERTKGTNCGYILFLCSFRLSQFASIIINFNFGF